MSPPSDELLAGLRPLHSPPPVSWWPPAPGWWLLAGLVLLVSFLIFFRYRGRRVRRYALAELASLDHSVLAADEYLFRLAALLKRYALYCYPSSGVEDLTCDDWLRFLDDHGGNGAFTKGCGQVIGNDLFRPVTHADPVALKELARQWIKKNRRRK
ncbi:MAG: DUF4381 domain-containing protein [Pseudomonadota bacterium]